MSVLAAFSAAVLKSHASARIDNFVFHLHYRVTAVILAAAAILVTSSEHFGRPISCGPAPPALSSDLLENYCWTRSTFSFVGPGGNEPYPGVSTVKQGDTVFYHTYYQWVWLVLTLQAAMFYLSRYIWKKIENGRMSCLVSGLTEPLCEKQSINGKVTLLSQYVLRNWNQLNKWAYGYFFCEVLNFVNVIGQIFIIDKFLGGTFTTYGSRVLQYGFLDQEYRNDTMVAIFPRLTKCTFRAFGPSGNFQIHDAICVLPLNIINEKIYVFLWFWLLFLAIPTGLVLVYRICLAAWPKLRVRVLHWQYNCFKTNRMDNMLAKANIGDWLFLNLLAKNVDGLALDMLLDEIEIEKMSTFKLPSSQTQNGKS
uniref:Innexin n=1 Tax=Strigamia maritima TaxID=126957 RepID=T1J6W8_STRMM